MFYDSVQFNDSGLVFDFASCKSLQYNKNIRKFKKMFWDYQFSFILKWKFSNHVSKRKFQISSKSRSRKKSIFFKIRLDHLSSTALKAIQVSFFLLFCPMHNNAFVDRFCSSLTEAFIKLPYSCIVWVEKSSSKKKFKKKATFRCEPWRKKNF